MRPPYVIGDPGMDLQQVVILGRGLEAMAGGLRSGVGELNTGPYQRRKHKVPPTVYSVLQDKR